MEKINEKIFSWCKDIEAGAMEQAINLSKHPFLFGEVCLMPDSHCGYGMPIGGVVALDNAISPNMVGVDIGCGMSAVKTNIKSIGRDSLTKIVDLINKRIPVGFRHQVEKQENILFGFEDWDKTEICKREKESAMYQLGTLGGGNHFIEIQKGSDGYIWFMIHSGSRNLGKQVADYYNRLAEDDCLTWKYDELVKNQIACFPRNTKNFEKYYNEMLLCLKFSQANRDLMGKRIKESFADILPDVDFDVEYNIQHNYARLENHRGKNIFVHRKGATSAKKDEIGIIPGSQGTASYIVRGLGNEASFCSSSHGSGRKMSRKFAREHLNFYEEKKKMDDLGIIHSIRTENDLDEVSSAYKDIYSVMEQQKDLVEPIVELKPLAVVKGN